MTSRMDTTGLDNILGNLDKRCDDILSKTAHEVEALAKVHAPRDVARPPKNEKRDITGELRESIKAEMVTYGRLWWVHDEKEYGIYQEQKEGLPDFLIYEIGGARIPARPFMSPAVEKVRPKFDRYFAELFK